jgi:signal transduction histidine kinase
MKRPALLAAATVALVVAGMLLGVQVDNLHNGLLALSFAVVGHLVLRRRPGNREAELFVLAGAAQAVMFFGRQVGGSADPPGPRWVAEWLGWLGIWPLPLVLVLVGATIMCYPDGRFPGRGWRIAFRAMLAAAVMLSVASALWPVDYDRAGLTADPPFRLPGGGQVAPIFDAAQPACFTAFQLVWLACVVARFRRASDAEARQLRWLVAAVAFSVVVLLCGLAVDGSPRAGLLTVPLIPVAAGIAIVEAAYEALVAELRASTRRVVTAQDEARQRIERDLHDGAQHRLVVLGMDLGRLVAHAEASGDARLAATASTAREQLMAATAELRDLARGIHPSVLTQDGLASALATLADGSPVPVTVEVEVPARCSPEAQATAYFVVAEALTNAARHSGAGHVSVRVRSAGADLEIEVADDGRGGATIGHGLQGLVDRVTALGGRLSVTEPPGGGTRVAAVLPCR